MTDPDVRRPARRTSVAAVLAQVGLGVFLLVAGIGHLTVAREAFRAQVPAWLPLDVDFVVVASGVVEILLGLSLLLLWRWRVPVGCIVAAFFVAVFPGNISQFATGMDAFGLNDDLSRGIRLLLQPLLVLWALWSTGAWRAWRASRTQRADEMPGR
ncbi:MAG: hypothetical protein ABWZ69_05340 [Mycetocola sp.]